MEKQIDAKDVLKYKHEMEERIRNNIQNELNEFKKNYGYNIDKIGAVFKSSNDLKYVICFVKIPGFD